ncbi:MAG: cytochrome c biogenesis protein CcsA [Caldilineaceae bacterium]|nr:cytochrome c biogenesis protein CcsA [Caldilineaceae bacterium]
MSAQSRPAATDRWFAPLLAFDIVAALAMVAVMWAALLYAGDAINLAGEEQVAQRIFYFHIGSNIAALLGFLASLIGSVGYLFSRRLVWDRWAAASVEIGTIFGIIVLLSGAIWAKPAWNTYWIWEPRLTTATITVLIYIAYMLFRNGFEYADVRARFAAIYAIFAFLSVPLTYYSARLFRSIHPIVFDGANQEAQGGFSIGPTMGQTLAIAMVGFAFLFFALLFHRVRQLEMEARIEEIREALDE